MTIKQRIQCSECDAAKETKLTPAGRPRIPNGWKRDGEAVYCSKCWQKKYVLRAVIVPLVGPENPADWPRLREAMYDVKCHTASLANWAINELAKADVARTPDMERLPKLESPYLYGLATERYPVWGWWEGQRQAANAILRASEKKYADCRYDVIWRNAAAWPVFRYGLPFPLDADAWALERVGQRIVLCVTLGGTRWRLVLRGGPEMRYWMPPINQLMSGEAIRIESQIYERTVEASAGQNGRDEANPGGGRKKQKRLFAKLVGWFPRPAVVERQEKVLHVRTGKDVFWSATIEGEEYAWVLHAEHIKRRVCEYMVGLGKISEDTKFEKRWPKKMRAKFGDRRDRLVRRHRGVIDSWQKESVASLVGYAKRKRVTKIVYDETQGYRCNPYPWFQQRVRLAQKCDQEGIVFECVASGEVVDETAGAARVEEVQ